MYAVIFEVYPTKEGKEEYLKIASTLKDFLQNREGFISIERFQSLVDENKLLSLSFILIFANFILIPKNITWNAVNFCTIILIYSMFGVH